MEKNDEIKYLREEITRLKLRLKELDSSFEVTSAVCGHDIVLNHLRILVDQHELSGLCQLAGTDKKHGWYTTNIEPSKIKSFLQDSNAVREFLAMFCKEGVWEALELAYHGEISSGDSEVLEFLEEQKLMANHKLTSQGFTCYAVLGHLTYNLTKKLEPNKAIEIYRLAFDLTGISFGETLPYSKEKFIELISTHPKYFELIESGVTVEDIGEYLRQNNV